MFYLGWLFIVTTTFLLFKPEVERYTSATGTSTAAQTGKEKNELPGIRGTYAILAKILTLKPMALMGIFLLTSQIAFATTDGMTDLKFVDAGVGIDRIATRRVLLIPLNVSTQ